MLFPGSRLLVPAWSLMQTKSMVDQLEWEPSGHLCLD